jgi:hypothetical protein
MATGYVVSDTLSKALLLFSDRDAAAQVGCTCSLRAATVMLCNCLIVPIDLTEFTAPDVFVEWPLRITEGHPLYTALARVYYDFVRQGTRLSLPYTLAPAHDD